jgi:hypothetical protein
MFKDLSSKLFEANVNFLLLYYLLSFLAYTGFYLLSEGKPSGEKPPSTTSYDYIRAFTYFYINL